MATQNTQPGPRKNRWTRWYMWVGYGWAAFVVVVIIIVAASPGDSTTAVTEEPVASAAANQTAAQDQQTKEAAELYEEQTKTAEKQDEAASEIQTKEAEDTLKDKYCKELTVGIGMIHEGVKRATVHAIIYQSGKPTPESNEDLGQTLNIIDEFARAIKSLDAPSDAKKVRGKAEDLADDLIKETKGTRDRFNRLVEYSRGQGLPITEHSTAHYIDSLRSALWEIPEVFESGTDKIIDTDYCPSVEKLLSEQ